MQKYNHAFGKNDVRGIYSEDITEELFYNIGLSYVEWLKKQTAKDEKDLRISVCTDARLHSAALKKALKAGLADSKAGYIEDLGLAPTPIGYYSEFAHNLDGAMIITASHNPKEYNGLKITFRKQSLNEKQINELKEITLKNWTPLPEYYEESDFSTDIIPEYIEDMKSRFGKIGEGIKIVVDSANATGGVVAPQLYRELGCEVVELFSEPDGTFPNHHPNPSILSTLETLSKTVAEKGADVGIAFDGDSDRIGVVDTKGIPLSGDKLLLIYAMDIIKTKGNDLTVVSEVKCSQILYDKINAAGADAVMCRTGHGYIKEKMKETGALLGGEMSGHTFFKDRYYGYDDAIYAGCRLIEIIAKNKKNNPNFKLEQLTEPFDRVYTSDEVRLPCPNYLKKEVLNSMEDEVRNNPDMFGAPIKEIITIDGMRIVFEGGFALVRQSNTEPVFTLRFEAESKSDCDKFKNIMVEYLDNAIKSSCKN